MCLKINKFLTKLVCYNFLETKSNIDLKDEKYDEVIAFQIILLYTTYVNKKKTELIQFPKR